MAGEEVTLDNCDREPIHIPGAIQPHGVLLACAGTTVTQVSANVATLLGRPPEAVLGARLTDLFAPGEAEAIGELVARDALREANPVALTAASGAPLEAVLHRSQEKLVVELEPRSSGAGAGFDPRLRRAIVMLQQARTVADLARVAAEEVRALTGFDRVMVYRFDADWNGQVVAESRREDLEPFLGLHYPASDIPAQARRLYTQNWIRLIGDAAYAPVPIVPTLDPASGAPLDLSQAHLRSVSPIHLEYLRNMGVRASMSISLISDGELIGLIACHHYAGPRLTGYVIRETAEYLGQALSWNLRVLEQADAAERVRRVHQCETAVANSLAASEDLLSGLAIPELAELAGAAGAAVVLDEGVRRVGDTPDERRIGEIVAWLRGRREDVLATDQLGAHYEGARHWDGAAAGLLATALSHELGEYILWFRPSTERTVDWAGDPRKQATPAEEGAPPRLSPRGSFALWRETVRGRSWPWERWQVAAASNLRRLLIGGARRRAAAFRALNEKLLEADRTKDAFIATVSHELRNPLNAISGWLGLYQSGNLSEHRRQEAIRVVARNTEALTRIVDDLLDVSRMASGTMTLEVENVDVGAIVDSVAATMALAAESKRLRIKRVIDSTPMSVLGDPGRIRQVVTNLVSNAIKFTPKEGSIALSLRRLESSLELLVQDTGQGLGPDALPHVFEPFWQADPSSRRATQGLGLGLAIAKKLVELHGGRIEVESEGLGRGTTFRMVLPVASARTTPSAPLRAPVAAASRVLEGVRVMVVEDEDDSRELLTHILENAGAVVRAAGGAVEALAVLAREPFDVIVSDIGMKDMDGLQMMTALRADVGARAARTPAVALTAYSRAVDRTTALRSGFQAHVPKPTDTDELITVVASLARRL